MIYIKQLGLIIALLFTCVCLNAQSNISGIITDQNTADPIIGATITVSNSNNGTITDIDGIYTLSVPSLNDTISVSYVGYTTKVIPLSGRNTINIELSVDDIQLQEVVVTGYGRQKKKLVSGAISQVSEKEIKAAPILRVEQALQGRTAGVQVINSSGQPGDEPSVRVRGIGTTGKAKPLYIVDGLAVGGIDYLNPGDIETIDVLKDAASAAIYGARAANGVVLITTKSGTKGRMTLGYDSYIGVQNAAKTLNLLNSDQYRSLMNEGALNAGLSAPFDLNQVADHDTDWQDALFVKNAPIQNHQITIAGGNEKSTYASSLSYFTQEGIIGGSKSQFERYTARLNSNHQVNKMFSFGNTLAYTHLIKRGIGTNQSFNGAYSGALNLDPLTPVIEDNDNLLAQYPYSIEPVVRNSEGEAYGISRNVGAEVVNPLALIEIDNDEIRKDQLVGSVFGTVEPIEGLKLKSNLGIDLAYLLNDGYRPLFFLNGAQLNDNTTSVNKRIERFYTWQWENTVAYDKTYGDHTIGGLAGISAQEYNYEDLSGFNTGVPLNDPDNVYLNLATDTLWNSGGGAVHSSLYSLFGRLNYSYKNKYSFSGILRRDGSSKFGANSRFGVFPSIGAAWVASDEDFLKEKLGPMNYLKLRASWGVNGNQDIGDYQFVSVIDQNRGYTFGGGRVFGSSPEFLENEDIRWEESTQLNFGADLAFFENKLQVTADYYIKETSGLLEKIPIPGHVGNEGPIANVGSVENKGLELAVNWRTTTRKIKYFVGINGAFNANKMTFIGNSEKVINGASWALEGTVTRAEEGLPIAYFWGFKTDGLFQNSNEVFQHINNEGEVLQPNAVPGDVRFVDVNNDGVIDQDDRTQIGNPTPDFTFGFNASIEYSNFDFSMFWQGTYGNEIFNGSQRQDLRFTNRTDAILDRWTGEGTSTTVPRYTWLDINNNSRVSDLYIEDGSYIRLKNIQVGYTLASSILDRIGATKWRFFVSAENLLTLTSYTGADPEIGANDSVEGSAFDIGIDRGIYPQAKTFRIGTSLIF